MTDVDPRDVEKVYGALSYYYVEDEQPVTVEELKPPFAWGDYLEDCLDRLVDVYDGAEKVEGGYRLNKLEQEKHMERSG